MIVAKGGDDEIVGGKGNDRICAGGGNDTAGGGGGTDMVSGGAGINTLEGNAGNDRLVGGPETDFQIGGAGDDSLEGGAGRDSLDYRPSTAGVVVDLTAGTSSGTADGNDTVSGFEQVIGSDYDDDIKGTPEGDTFFPNAGNDDVDGGGGPDLVSYFLAPGPVTVDLQAGTATGSHGNDTLTNGVIAVRGGEFDDVLTGSDGNNDIIGGDGGDQIDAAGASDYIIPGPGNDSIDGGADELDANNLDSVGDSVEYLDATAAIDVDLAAGTVTGGTGDDTVADIEFVVGSLFDDILRGSQRANEGFAGEDGDDLIDGRGGGLDTTDYTFAPERVTVDLAAGTASGNGQDTLIGIEWVIGSAFDDVISGGPTDDILFGGDGNDDLDGKEGQDLIRGEDGTDSCANGETVQTCES